MCANAYQLHLEDMHSKTCQHKWHNWDFAADKGGAVQMHTLQTLCSCLCLAKLVLLWQVTESIDRPRLSRTYHTCSRGKHLLFDASDLVIVIDTDMLHQHILFIDVSSICL